MSILVTGSTGVVGRQVLDHLVGKAADIRALTRKPESATLPAGVEPVRGELADVDSLRAAMRGTRTVFLLAPNAADELTQTMLALAVAKQERVQGVVYLSVFRGAEYADVPHFASKVTVERLIEASDLPVTVLRPAYFMQNDARMKDALLGPGVYGMPIGERGISMVDVRDIGEAAARELVRRHDADAPLPRETHALVGPDVLDGPALARVWGEALGLPIAYGGNDLDALETRLRSFSPAWYAYELRLMMARYQDTGAAATGAEVDRFARLLGRAPRRYADFAQEAAAQWAGR